MPLITTRCLGHRILYSICKNRLIKKYKLNICSLPHVDQSTYKSGLKDSLIMSDQQRKLKKIQLLGQGGFGEVYLCEYQGKEYATKFVSRKVLAQDPDLLPYLLRQIQVMHDLQCENIVKIYHNFQTKNNFIMLLEYCNGGDLNEYLRLKGGFLKIDEATEIMTQIMKGLIYLYSKKVVHRDIKLENIVAVKTNGRVSWKITDFGLCITNKSKNIGSVLGTMPYMSPDIFLQNYDYRVDIWAFGILFYKLTTGEFPFGQCEIDVINKYKLYSKRQNLKTFIQLNKHGDKSKLLQDENFPRLAQLLEGVFSRKDQWIWSKIIECPIFNLSKNIPLKSQLESKSRIGKQLHVLKQLPKLFKISELEYQLHEEDEQDKCKKMSKQVQFWYENLNFLRNSKCWNYELYNEALQFSQFHAHIFLLQEIRLMFENLKSRHKAGDDCQLCELLLKTESKCQKAVKQYEKCLKKIKLMFKQNYDVVQFAKNYNVYDQYKTEMRTVLLIFYQEIKSSGLQANVGFSLVIKLFSFFYGKRFFDIVKMVGQKMKNGLTDLNFANWLQSNRQNGRQLSKFTKLLLQEERVLA